MPYLVNKLGNIVTAPNKCLLNYNSVKITYDTEFTYYQLLKLVVDACTFYIPSLNPDLAIIYPYEELNEDFNPWLDPLKVFGNKIEPFDQNKEDFIAELNDIFENVIDNITSARKLQKEFKSALNNGAFDQQLKLLNFERNYLKCEKDKYSGEFELIINLPQLIVEYEAFFSDVDLFKTIGKYWHHILLEANLESRRIITTHNGLIKLSDFPFYINDQPFEIGIKLRDAMNRLPVLSGKSLANQCKVLKADIQKLDIETDELAAKIGLNSKDDIKRNMTVLRNNGFLEFLHYCAVDVFATHSLSFHHQKYLDDLRHSFGLEPVPIKDTTGSIVSRFLIDLQHQHFNPSKTKELSKLINKKRRQSNCDKLQNLELNNFGIQPFRTVGGLLYSRTTRFPYLKGYFGDLDQKSCYATALSHLNIYLGQPIISTFKSKKSKPSFREVLQFVRNNCPRDAWFVRVSGQLNHAINTLILSDLDFQPKKKKFKTIFDLNPNRKSINLFNAFKTNNPEASSTILTKQIKFGLINADLMDMIATLPDRWIDEYLDLKVDCLVFVPNELICNSAKELLEKIDNYPDEETLEKFDPKTGLKDIQSQYSQNNLCLCFPIQDYYRLLKTQRELFKTADNPIQEVYKIFLNSGYGAIACEFLAVNNLLAANQVTASARATAWMMINALNGFQVITDGSTFSWKHIPLGLKFKDLITNNPDYLLDFDPNLKSNFDLKHANQEWIDRHFKEHLFDFYDIDHNHIPANRFNFELKDEKFTDRNGIEVKTTLFTEFANTGSGNYAKGLGNCILWIEGYDYKFDEQFKKVKARSFKGNDRSLLNWYINCLENEYTQPFIYHESQIIKFGEANKIAIQFLESGIEEITHPTGFSKETFKIMKLVTRSQFLFQNEKQLVNFERTNQLGKLDKLSNFFLNKSYWKTLNLNQLKPYGVSELLPNFNYYDYAKQHPIGLGFELLSLNSSHKNSIASVRNEIADKIKLGKSNFNSALHIDRNLTLARLFKNSFAATIVLKANAEEKLKTTLINSTSEPTQLVVNKDNITTLAQLLQRPEDEF